MTVRRGQTVLVDYPHADGSGMSLRPALIVQADTFNQKLQNTIVAQITSKIRHLHSACRLLIDPTMDEGKSSGLHMVSVLTCVNLGTINQSRIHHVLGNLSDSLMKKVDVCLKAALELT